MQSYSYPTIQNFSQQIICRIHAYQNPMIPLHYNWTSLCYLPFIWYKLISGHVTLSSQQALSSQWFLLYSNIWITFCSYLQNQKRPSSGEGFSDDFHPNKKKSKINAEKTTSQKNNTKTGGDNNKPNLLKTVSAKVVEQLTPLYRNNQFTSKVSQIFSINYHLACSKLRREIPALGFW